MKKILTCVVALTVMIGWSTAFALVTAQSPPWWWDNPNSNPTYRTAAATITVENQPGTGQVIDDTLSAQIDNIPDRHARKWVFIVAELETDDTNVTWGNLGLLTWVSPWGGGSAQMNLVADSDPNDLHYEFEYYWIDPQPEKEFVGFDFFGLTEDHYAQLDYDLRTICFPTNGNGGIPEPTGLALLAGGLVGLLRKKRS